MSRDNDKRELREHKRELKRMGNKRVRREARSILESDPEDAVDIEVDYGTCGTKHLNGLDRKPG